MDNSENTDENEEFNLDIYQEYGWKLIQKEVRGKSIEIVKKEKINFLSVYKSIIDNPTINIQMDILSLTDLAELASKQSLSIFNISGLIFPTISFFWTSAMIRYNYHYFMDEYYWAMIRIIPFVLLFIFLISKSIRLLQLKRYYQGKRPKLKWDIKPHFLLIAFSFVLCTAIGIYVDPERYSERREGTYLGDIDNLVNLRIIEGEYSSHL